MIFWLLAPAGSAQSAINLIASRTSIPLRNLQIEVRQIQRSSREQTGVQASGTLQLDASGQEQAQARVQLRDQQDHQSGAAAQQVLVLNGRSAHIALRTSTPFRLMQTVFRNGQAILVQGTVLLDASTGFTATPRWDGSDQAELELAATQASPASSTASTLLVPVGEWVTVAQSDLEGQSARRGLLGNTSQTEQQASELQVRLTLR